MNAAQPAFLYRYKSVDTSYNSADRLIVVPVLAATTVALPAVKLAEPCHPPVLRDCGVETRFPKLEKSVAGLPLLKFG